MPTTLANLTDRARQESDNVNSTFVATTGSPTEWTNYINQSFFEIYGLTAQVYGAEYYVVNPAPTFVTDGINDKFALPADFFKLLGVDVLYGGTNQWTSLRRFTIGDRNKFSAINAPIPAANQTVRLLYVPRPTALTAAVDLPDALEMNGWSEYIVVDAAMKAIAKEEGDVSVLMARKQALIDRINAEADNRDAANPQRITDSRGRGSGGMEYHLWGSNIWLIGWNARGWPGNDWDQDLALGGW